VADEGGTRRVRAAVTLVLAVFLLGACGSPSPDPSTVSSAPTTSPATTSTSTPPTTAGGTVLTLTDADKGRTVPVHVGDEVQVVLGSTYWTVQASSDPAVLASVGQPVVAPQPSGCVPGEGCGTVTATFRAAGPGTATVSAGRTSCGEAMGCTGDSGSYEVTLEAS
jgi:hypothetical protein